MQSVIPDPSRVILISAENLNGNFYPRDLVDGIVDRASWFVLMEKIESKKSMTNLLQSCCFCCNVKRMVMQGVCNEVNLDFYTDRPIYMWTKDDKLSINAQMLQVDIAEREKARISSLLISNLSRMIIDSARIELWLISDALYCPEPV